MRKILSDLFNKIVKYLSTYRIGKLYFGRIIWDFLYRHLYFFLKNISDKYEIEFLKNTIRGGDIVLDIGAGVGYYTIIFCKLVGERGKVYAFEPDSENFNLLKKNIEKTVIKM